ncbi:MAG: translation initiation factor eIF-2B [Candidatus Woesearchaeota archaeon]
MSFIFPKFSQVVKNIQELRIQGAQNIAESAVSIFTELEQTAFSYFHHMSDYAKELKRAKDILCNTRPTEPLLKNSLHYIFADRDILYYDSMQKLHENIVKKTQEVRSHFQDVHEKLPNIGSKKIRKKMVVFTHCHSSNVVAILRNAKEQKKDFSVCQTETRPRFQGRITATELSQLHIPVKHFVDSALRIAIKESDCVLLGADAIDYAANVFNKIGSELVCEIATLYKKPIYICTDSWKFDPYTDAKHEELIESRNPDEIWEKPPKGILISNPAFEKIHPKHITGIISEMGIHTPKDFLFEIRKRYPFLHKIADSG